jgi:hypothetical protein
VNQQLFVSLVTDLEKSTAQLYTAVTNTRMSGAEHVPPRGLLFATAAIVGHAAAVKALAEALLGFTQAAVLKDDVP